MVGFCFCFGKWTGSQFSHLSGNHCRSTVLKAQSPCGYWKVFMDPINSVNLGIFFGFLVEFFWLLVFCLVYCLFVLGFFNLVFCFGRTPSNLVTCRERNSVTEFWWQQEIAVSLPYDFRKIHPQIILELRKMKKYRVWTEIASISH